MFYFQVVEFGQVKDTRLDVKKLSSNSIESIEISSDEPLIKVFPGYYEIRIRVLRKVSANNYPAVNFPDETFLNIFDFKRKPSPRSHSESYNLKYSLPSKHEIISNLWKRISLFPFPETL